MNILKDVETIFRDVFDDDELVVTEDTSAADIEDWDSLMHVTLILEIESAFKVRFSSGDVANLDSVGDLCTLIQQSLA